MEKYVFLDANVYIGANYSFNNRYFNKLSELISNDELVLLGCSICFGEVEKHIGSDLATAISEFNKALKSRSFASIRYDIEYENKLAKLDTEDVVEHVKKNFRRYLKDNRVDSFSIEGISTEELMQNYFDKKPPFEEKKPNEFKDAIMIMALKRYQSELGETVLIISNDIGFRDAFKDDKEFVLFEKLSDFLSYHQRNDKVQQSFEKYFGENIDEDTIYNELSILAEEINYTMDEREEFQLTKFIIDDIEFRLDYVEIEDEENAQAFIAATFFITIECEYLDIDNSYYDKEDAEYIVKSYIQSKENHQFEKEIRLDFKYQQKEENDNYELSFVKVNTEEFDNSIDLSLEDTFIDCYYEKSVMPKKYKEYFEKYGTKCSECGKFLGFGDEENYHDYNGESLCALCAVTNENGFICSQCGFKYPYWRQGNSGVFCIDCERDYDH